MGPKIGLGRRTLLALGLTFALLAFYGSVGNMRLNEMDATDRWMSETQRVLAEVDDCRVGLLDAQSSLRGFQLSHDAAMRESFQAAADRTNASVARLENLVGDDEPLEAEVRDVRREVLARLQSLEQSLGQPNSTAAADHSDAPAEGRAMLQTLASLSQIKQQCGELLTARHARSQAAFDVMRFRM
ncbi:MAG TPA: CHASE3 domain-containing protein, partial [Pirellulales bacterium]|nr:CHASE3 domain-containing protein [Pirellulales bacterium]